MPLEGVESTCLTNVLFVMFYAALLNLNAGKYFRKRRWKLQTRTFSRSLNRQQPHYNKYTFNNFCWSSFTFGLISFQSRAYFLRARSALLPKIAFSQGSWKKSSSKLSAQEVSPSEILPAETFAVYKVLTSIMGWFFYSCSLQYQRSTC